MGVPAPAPGAPRVGFWFFWGGGRGEKHWGEQSWVLPALILPMVCPQGEARGVWRRQEAGDGGVCEAEVSAKKGVGMVFEGGEVFLGGRGKGGNPGVHRAATARVSARLFIPHRRATTVVPPPPVALK